MAVILVQTNLKDTVQDTVLISTTEQPFMSTPRESLPRGGVLEPTEDRESLQTPHTLEDVIAATIFPAGTESSGAQTEEESAHVQGAQLQAGPARRARSETRRHSDLGRPESGGQTHLRGAQTRDPHSSSDRRSGDLGFVSDDTYGGCQDTLSLRRVQRRRRAAGDRQEPTSSASISQSAGQREEAQSPRDSESDSSTTSESSAVTVLARSDQGDTASVPRGPANPLVSRELPTVTRSNCPPLGRVAPQTKEVLLPTPSGLPSRQGAAVQSRDSLSRAQARQHLNNQTGRLYGHSAKTSRSGRGAGGRRADPRLQPAPGGGAGAQGGPRNPPRRRRNVHAKLPSDSRLQPLRQYLEQYRRAVNTAYWVDSLPKSDLGKRAAKKQLDEHISSGLSSSHLLHYGSAVLPRTRPPRAAKPIAPTTEAARSSRQSTIHCKASSSRTSVYFQSGTPGSAPFDPFSQGSSGGASVATAVRASGAREASRSKIAEPASAAFEGSGEERVHRSESPVIDSSFFTIEDLDLVNEIIEDVQRQEASEAQVKKKGEARYEDLTPPMSYDDLCQRGGGGDNPWFTDGAGNISVPPPGHVAASGSPLTLEAFIRELHREAPQPRGGRVNRFCFAPIPLGLSDLNILAGDIGEDASQLHRLFLFHADDPLKRTWPLRLPEESLLGEPDQHQRRQDIELCVQRYDDWHRLQKRLQSSCQYAQPTETVTSSTTSAPSQPPSQSLLQPVVQLPRLPQERVREQLVDLTSAASLASYAAPFSIPSTLRVSLIPQPKTTSGRPRASASARTTPPSRVDIIKVPAQNSRAHHLQAGLEGLQVLPPGLCNDLTDEDIGQIRFGYPDRTAGANSAELPRINRVVEGQLSRSDALKRTDNVQPELNRPDVGLNLSVTPALYGDPLSLSRTSALIASSSLRQLGQPRPNLSELVRYDPNNNQFKVCLYNVPRRHREDFYECCLCAYTDESVEPVMLHIIQQHIRFFYRAMTQDLKGRPLKQ